MKHWAYYRAIEHNSNGKVCSRLIDFIYDNSIADMVYFYEKMMKEKLFKIKLDIT